MFFVFFLIIIEDIILVYCLQDGFNIYQYMYFYIYYVCKCLKIVIFDVLICKYVNIVF